MSEFSNLSSLKLLRSVDLLSRLTILQLSHIADMITEVPFSDGQTIANEVAIFKFLPSLAYSVDSRRQQNTTACSKNQSPLAYRDLIGGWLAPFKMLIILYDNCLLLATISYT